MRGEGDERLARGTQVGLRRETETHRKAEASSIDQRFSGQTHWSDRLWSGSGQALWSKL